ncbi:hypothetical protein ACJMK2_008415 [Sinanodonta woodiana]|uniref:1,4-dihydroxy-2-naphthoate octaprenyltransferase n=1 Tax=Sinanodonta woodiana TaxID=1069815 RepID=A0ABD3VMS2_SINWO
MREKSSIVATVTESVVCREKIDKGCTEKRALHLDDEVKPISVMEKWLVALRPWSFTASFTPVALGSILAYKSTGEFSFTVFLATLFTALSVHAAGNLVNTYFDYMKGIDGKTSDDRTLVDKLLQPHDVAWLGTVSYFCGMVGFVILVMTSPAKMEHIALMFFGGLSSSFMYTGGLGLKYIALGDLVIFLSFGPLTVMFAFLTQAGKLSTVTLLYAIPLALNTVSILHANNTRDMDSDKKAKIVTVSILLGKTGSYILFVFLLFAPYIIFVLMGLHISPWLFLPLLTVKNVFDIERFFRSGSLRKVPYLLAQLNLLIGLLYVVGVFMTDAKSLPELVVDKIK